MIVNKIEAYLRDRKEYDSLAHRAEKMTTGEIALSFRRNFCGERSEDRPLVTLSSHFYCARHIHYDLAGHKKDDVSPRALLVFFLGDVGHAAVRGLEIGGAHV